MSSRQLAIRRVWSFRKEVRARESMSRAICIYVIVETEGIGMEKYLLDVRAAWG